MKLCIQDPTWSESEYLLESLVASSLDATSGGGAFAFASTGGVKLLLEDGTFQEFLSRSPFELIVGVDAITNVSALDRLMASMSKHPNLNVNVFLSDGKSGLFHPKLCWFRGPQHSVFLVGSGNLTVAGLRGNREGFSLSKLGKKQRIQPHGAWSSWLCENKQLLLPPSHPDVIKRAKRNRGNEFGKHFKDEPISEDDTGGIIVGPPHAGDAVLIAEIPRSGNRWNQANFDLETFGIFSAQHPGKLNGLS